VVEIESSLERPVLRRKMGSDRSLGASMYGLRMLAGGVAGVIAKTTLAPLDRIRIMAQTGASSVGMFATINVVVKQDGVG